MPLPSWTTTTPGSPVLGESGAATKYGSCRLTSTPSADGDRIDRAAAAARDQHRRDDQQRLEALVGGHPRQHHVLQQRDAEVDQQLDVHRQEAVVVEGNDL